MNHYHYNNSISNENQKQRQSLTSSKFFRDYCIPTDEQVGHRSSKKRTKLTSFLVLRTSNCSSSSSSSRMIGFSHLLIAVCVRLIVIGLLNVARNNKWSKVMSNPNNHSYTRRAVEQWYNFGCPLLLCIEQADDDEIYTPS